MDHLSNNLINNNNIKINSLDSPDSIKVKNTKGVQKREISIIKSSSVSMVHTSSDEENSEDDFNDRAEMSSDLKIDSVSPAKTKIKLGM